MIGFELLDALSAGVMSRDWHWYAWHAEHYQNGNVTAFFGELMLALTFIEGFLPGSAEQYVQRIISIGGRNRNQADYDQLCQVLAEIDVLQRTGVHSWPDGTTYEFEPSVTAGGANPEAVFRAPEYTLGIEVKAPRIREWRNAMGLGWQAVSRAIPRETLDYSTLPRDNAIKDAVISSDTKYRALRAKEPHILGVMVLVWDYLMNEPISALVNPASGLFTPNTFDVEKRTFPDLDAVLIVPHLGQLIEGPGNRNFVDARGTFHWPKFPVIPYVINPNSSRRDRVGEVLHAIFNAEDQRGLRYIGAEYGESDVVLWVDPRAGGAADDTPPIL